jgi:hypothetical protein
VAERLTPRQQLADLSADLGVTKIRLRDYEWLASITNEVESDGTRRVRVLLDYVKFIEGKTQIKFVADGQREVVYSFTDGEPDECYWELVSDSSFLGAKWDTPLYQPFYNSDAVAAHVASVRTRRLERQGL